MMHNQRGFTLLEVLVAIVLFSMAILLFSSVFVSSFRASKNQETQLVAINLARQVASEWGSKSYTELKAEVGDSYPLSNISINERTYRPIVRISFLDPIVIITVEITSPNSSRPLAVVHSSVGN